MVVTPTHYSINARSLAAAAAAYDCPDPPCAGVAFRASAAPRKKYRVVSWVPERSTVPSIPPTVLQ